MKDLHIANYNTKKELLGFCMSVGEMLGASLKSRRWQPGKDTNNEQE
jgi:hypothetical protein